MHFSRFADAFENNIRSAVENAITKKIFEGTGKLDSFLQSLPKQIDMDNIAALNVTFVDDPVVGNSSIEFDVNGLFVQSTRDLTASYLHKHSHSIYSVQCGNTLKMLGISLDEAVFDSASLVLFEVILCLLVACCCWFKAFLVCSMWNYELTKECLRMIG